MAGVARVSRREFEQYTSKYLKELPIIVTMRGVDDFIVKEVEDAERELDEAVVLPVQGSEHHGKHVSE